VDLSNIYVDLSDVYVNMPDNYVDFSDSDVDLSNGISTCQKNVSSIGMRKRAWTNFRDEFLNKLTSNKSTKRSVEST
jgi:hypothetical protein